MEQKCPESGTPKILQGPWRLGYREDQRKKNRGILVLLCSASLVLLTAVGARPARAQEPLDSTREVARSGSSHWWQLFAAGFASSVLAHEGGHIAAAYVVGGRPSFGLNEGRPTIYSGIDANLEPHKQFVFSSAGLTVQTLIDEAIIDSPHHSSSRAGAFERGMLAGGIATSLFYVTIGRTGSVSDVEFMARTSTLSKTAITAIYGGAAVLHMWRIGRNDRYARFFARPNPTGGVRVGLTVDP